ncbi:FYVE, RhoGEF and PH domain-containing protein 4-like [Stegastes partitus]|uniref:FYVE, RhoGEF and PH domain-containing protein 4-like n=2 Tax=Stegastes partitus TaxID=144197 RepID=A0A9Y4JUE4_9TELE|nr:PREDICTED: FYVE, RhoGEF and PH domain-containing protein 4-like [Stegastes partitus]
MFDLKKRNSLTLKGGRESEEFRRVAVRRKVRGAVGDCDGSVCCASDRSLKVSVKMFDLKKRNSLTLKGGRESEEFRRVAVRRKVRGAVGDCDGSDLSGGLCGSYSCARARASELNSYFGSEEDNRKSPVKGSPLKPQVPPKPAHLQSPPSVRQDPVGSTRAALPQQINGTEPDQSPNRGHGVPVPCFSPPQGCLGSLSPVRGGGSHLLNGARQGIPNLASSPVLGSPSPGKRGIQNCSPLREGGHSPAKLSPRNHSPLMGKLRTPSPAQGKMSSSGPAKSSMSWLSLHRIPNNKMDRGKSLSVPDLVVYMDESRLHCDKSERSPLKPMQSLNCNGPAAAHHRLNHTTDEGHRTSPDRETSTGRINDGVQRTDWMVVNGVGDEMEVGRTPTRHGSKYSCQWTKAGTGDGRIQEESRGDGNEEEEEEEEEGGEELKDEESTEQKLYKIANELLQTEKAYVARLHLLNQVFCSRLTEEAGRGSFPPEVIRNIFSNISSIYSFHSQFLLPDLESCIRHWCERPGLGKVLLQNAPFLRMYADYVRNFDQAVELVRTWTERSSAFRSIIQDIQSQEVCGNLTLQHHMLEPVQRVPRYEMLLKDYLKKLPEDNPDYEFAHKSLETISMAATHSNSAIHKAESLKRLLEIYEMVGEEEVVNPTNEFLREGRLLKLAARNTSAMERHLFLFNNFLLCCSPRFSLVGQRFTVRCRIGVEGMHVQQTTNEDHQYTFQVSGKERTLELQASSEQDRDEWIKTIQEAIDVFQRKHETFKLASKELNVGEPSEELGRRAPRWIRDNEVTLCMNCQEPFNALTRRRHHCRACGFVVCWRCSDNKVALEYDGNKLNKVCKTCFSILTGQRGDKVDGKRRRRTLESDPPPGSTDGVMSGFLQYGDSPVIRQRVWCVLTRTEPSVLHLYAEPQDVKPLLSVPLPGCSVDSSPQELRSRPGFCLNQNKTSHVFSCEDPDLRQSWLTALKAAAATSNGIGGPGCGGVRGGEEVNKENES